MVLRSRTQHSCRKGNRLIVVIWLLRREEQNKTEQNRTGQEKTGEDRGGEDIDGEDMG